MSKKSIARKGMTFINAHNGRVLKNRAVKAAQKELEAAYAAKKKAVLTYGLFSPEFDAAVAAQSAAYAARKALYCKHDYLTISDRALISVFGA